MAARLREKYTKEVAPALTKEFGYKTGKLIIVSLRVTVLDKYVLALDVAEFSKAILKGRNIGINKTR